MRTRAVAAVQVAAVGLTLAACAPGPGTPTAAPSPSPSAPAIESPTESPIPTDPSAPDGQCADDALRVTIEPHPEGNSAGHVISLVVFTNIGTTPCVLQGAPSVAVIDANGEVIDGGATQLDGRAPPLITIEPGGRAVAGLSAADIGDDGGPLGDLCPVVPGSAYRVYPPHSYTPIEVPADVPACDGDDIGWMTVTVVREG